MLAVFFLAALIVAYVVCPLFPGVELDHLSGRIRACREEGVVAKNKTKVQPAQPDRLDPLSMLVVD
jgi:hypothetical protein